MRSFSSRKSDGKSGLVGGSPMLHVLVVSLCAGVMVPLMACQGGMISSGEAEGDRASEGASSDDSSESPSTDDDLSGHDDNTNGELAEEDVSVEFEDCTAVAETARNVYEPVDVIVTVDNTTSMYNEVEEVRANLNRLSAAVRERGLNMRVILISCLTLECLEPHEDCEFPPCWHSMCVDPPLGAEGGCPYEGDTNLPDYLHVDHRVESLKALENIIETYDQWSSSLRPGAARHLIVVSDDNDYWSPAQFNEALLALDPRFAGYRFHGIYSYESKFQACHGNGEDSPCCIYAAPDGEGTVYRDLVEMTGGVSGDLCLQDFDPVFDRITEAILESVDISCEWVIPDPPEGYLLDPDLVNVQFIDGDGNHQFIGRVESEEACSSVAQGWYYDDPVNPTGVFVCPQTCEGIQDREGSAMKILFGCDTIPEPLI